ncbi:MAG: peptide chain release factor N(5)-glutamine methyltransferase [Candidatus Coatesbacteria bacterium]|nr:MAG: peptide chain release factor N(5)-glutamine methyltransferase [Candidatus Coatesbacteria bacterium]
MSAARPAVAAPPERPCTVAEIKRFLAEALPAREGASPRAEAAALLAFVLDTERSVFVADSNRTVSDEVCERLRRLVERRRAGEPLQYLTGSAPFLDLTLAVGPGAFVPRPETEGLALHAERLLPAGPAPTIVDLCAGVGPVAIYLARRRPRARLVALEAEEKATALLRQNAARYEVALEVVVGDAFAPATMARLPAADLITANPPYIPSAVIPNLPPEVRDWEAASALDGGPDGLRFYPRIAELAVGYLRPGGAVIVEIGEGQAGAVKRILGAVGEVAVGQDLAGRDRYVWARREEVAT